MPWFASLKLEEDSSLGKFKTYALTKSSAVDVKKEEIEQREALLKEQQWEALLWLFGNIDKTRRKITKEQNIKRQEAGSGLQNWMRNLPNSSTGSQRLYRNAKAKRFVARWL